MNLDLSGQVILAVFAHPDDESIAAGGLLAWTAALGAQVTVLSLTHGEQGGSVDPDAPTGSFALGDLRARELEAAGRALGIHGVRLLAHPDGLLPWVDATALERDIRRVAEDTHARVVVTFDEDGLYWHPDHVATHERVTTAVASMGDQAPALYYTSMPAGAMRALMDTALDRIPPDATPPRSILGVDDPDAFGSLAPAPTHVLDTREFARRKYNALRCHQSQQQTCALPHLTEQDSPRLLGLEHYRRASLGTPGATFLDRLRLTHSR